MRRATLTTWQRTTPPWRASMRPCTTKATWMARRFPDLQNGTIAYFSAEFAIHQSLPIYAGGLGVLAGDHCKEASDLGLPIIGVGFMGPQGYFHQYTISSEGWQVERLRATQLGQRARSSPQSRPKARPCFVAVPLGARSVYFGGVPSLARLARKRKACYLLDTDLEEKAPGRSRALPPLYGGDHDAAPAGNYSGGRGGSSRLGHGLRPAVLHLNEGHAAFFALQRMREFVALGHVVRERRARKSGGDNLHDPHARPRGPRPFAYEMVEQHLAGVWGPLDEPSCEGLPRARSTRSSGGFRCSI